MSDRGVREERMIMHIDTASSKLMDEHSEEHKFVERSSIDSWSIAYE